MPTPDVALRRSYRDLRAYVAERGAKAAAKEVLDAFRSNNLLTYASAISYQLLFALVPALLAGIAVLGFLDLESWWRQDVAPRVREQLSDAGFEVLNDTVTRVLTTQQGYWVSFGVVFALWQISGAVRAAMRALNEIYGERDDRSFVNRLATSFACAAIFLVGVGITVAALQAAPLLAGELGAVGAWAARVGGWVVAFAVLALLSAILLRLAPVVSQPWEWLGFVTAVVVTGWLLATAAFGSWIVWAVSYTSVYGGFAAAILLMTYLYLLVTVFLAGVQLDTLVRSRARSR